MLAAWAAGLISFIFALTATVKSKPKSVLVCIVGCVTFLTTVYGIFAVL
jgi:hypothetical protein